MCVFERQNNAINGFDSVVFSGTGEKASAYTSSEGSEARKKQDEKDRMREAKKNERRIEQEKRLVKRKQIWFLHSQQKLTFFAPRRESKLIF